MKDLGGKDSGIERLNKSLYSRKPRRESVRVRPVFEPKEKAVEETWGTHDLPVGEDRPLEEEGMSIAKKVLLFSSIFFLGALGVAAFVFFGEGNIVSADNVNISIFGPLAVAGGEEMSLEVSVENNNNTMLEDADLIIAYPSGARRETNLNTELRRERIAIGNIPPGGSDIRKVRAILFGEEGGVQTVTFTVEYRVKGSRAIFEKQKSYDITISSSPVSLLIRSRKEANNEQEILFEIVATSNSNTTLTDLLLRAEYPFGFEFTRATPRTSLGTTLWDLGDLAVEGKRTVTIAGKLRGEEGEERVFKFFIGRKDPAREHEIGTTYTANLQTITMRKPFIALTLALDGDTAKEYVARLGRPIRADIVWTNNIAAPILDGVIEVKLSGDALNRFSVSSDKGFFRSLDNTILWDRSRVAELSLLNPGESGRVSFSFASLEAGPSSSMKNPEIQIAVSVRARQTVLDTVTEEVSSLLPRTVKFSSALSLSAMLLRLSGPFQNSGPVPPVAETETTYTVAWALTNAVNDVSGVKVSSALPPYARFVGPVSPAGEKVSYNPVGGEIVWDAGRIPAYAGFSSPPREVFFQIAVTPSITQIGSAPALSSEIVVIGEDDFTGASVAASRPALTTHLSTSDPAMVGGHEVVVGKK
ncbi:MAG: Uncharacterized protein G01um101472_171 [Parcubacteria group bacterium Gr01-1014_72]|nr:MAG: Uncharacterized protein G01um101472_171 [Parcubacteria group bacterium Gr01-1014_72]